MADDDVKHEFKNGDMKSSVEERLRVLQLRQSADADSAASKTAQTTEHKFWDTQPVPRLDERNAAGSSADGPIEEVRTVGQVSKTPLQLLPQFKWCEMDVHNEAELTEVYKFLNENYVEDDDAMFRFDYSPAFLKWALTSPGWRPEWHVGVRVKAAPNKLVGFITAVPVFITVHEARVHMVEINFLCIHKKLRSKRLAPVLIREITRRVNLENIWQAVYTAGVLLPRPVARCRYYHRSLNPKKLVKVGFSRLAPRMTMMRTIKLFTLPDKPQTAGIREMRKADLEAAHKLVQKYHQQHRLRVDFSAEDFEHWLMPLEGVVNSYVVENPKTKQITDFGSFYLLPSSIIQSPEYTRLNAAYLFYYAAGGTPLLQLMRDLLVMAREEGCDVFNALDVMDNMKLFQDLKFHIGDGQLNYYLYNWNCAPIESSENALVML